MTARMTEFREHLRTTPPIPRRICYVAHLTPDSTSDYRTRALQRLGQQVDTFDLRAYSFQNPRLEVLRTYYPFGPMVAGINRGLVARVRNIKPDIVIFDKPILITPESIAAIKDTGAKVVFYLQDNPFGPRNDGCWKQFLRIHRMADLHCTFRPADVRRYTAWGLPFVPLMFSYEPSIHFPPHDNWTDSHRDREISYIGSPHENRPRFLIDLSERFSLPLSISGDRWNKFLTLSLQRRFSYDGPLLGKNYREAIWKSKVNLSFVTELNEDDIAHKAIETAAAGGFLLALRTPGHQECFEEDREAVFFSTIEECAEKAAYYLAHEEERRRIASRGHRRAIESGYSNDTQLAYILNYCV